MIKWPIILVFIDTFVRSLDLRAENETEGGTRCQLFEILFDINIIMFFIEYAVILRL